MEMVDVPIEVKALADASYDLYRLIEGLADKEGVKNQDPDLAIYIADKIFIQTLYDLVKNHMSINATRELIQEYHEVHDDKKKRLEAVKKFIIAMKVLGTLNLENPETIEMLRNYYAQYYGEEEAEDYVKDVMSTLINNSGMGHDERQYI